MPTMPRMTKKATQVSYKVLGRPANQKKKTRSEKELDKRLQVSETWRLR